MWFSALGWSGSYLQKDLAVNAGLTRYNSSDPLLVLFLADRSSSDCVGIVLGLWITQRLCVLIEGVSDV